MHHALVSPALWRLRLVSLAIALASTSTWADRDECKTAFAECRTACVRSSDRACNSGCLTTARACAKDDSSGGSAPTRPGRLELTAEAKAAIERNNSFAGEEVPNGAYDGPARFLHLRLLDEKSASIERMLNTRNSRPEDAFFTRDNGAKKQTESRDLRIRIAGYQKLKCVYGGRKESVADIRNRVRFDSAGDKMFPEIITFWKSSRPQLSPEAVNWYRDHAAGSYSVDAAVDQCPALYQEALVAALGRDWRKQFSADSERIANEQRAAPPMRVSKGDSDEYRKFPAESEQAVEPLSREQLRSGLDLDLARKGEEPGLGRQVVAAATRIEDHYDTMQIEQVEAIIDKSIEPHLNPLLAAARANFPGEPNAKGKLSSDEWEEQFVRPVFLACTKLMAIADVYARAGPSGVGSQFGAMLRNQKFPTRSDWAGVSLNYRRLCEGSAGLAFRLLQTRLTTQPVLDQSYMAKVFRDAKISAAEQRDARAESPATPNTVTRTVVTQRIFRGTPGQIAAAVVTSNVVEGAANLAGAYGKALAEREFSIQRQVKTRADFWDCYKARCDDKGASFLHYMWLLDQRDRLRFLSALKAARDFEALSVIYIAPRYTPGISDTRYSLDNICSYFAESLGRAWNSIPTSARPDNLQDVWPAVIKNPGYQRWAECRDKVEYLLRP